jgi:hypothetical protein
MEKCGIWPTEKWQWQDFFIFLPNNSVVYENKDHSSCSSGSDRGNFPVVMQEGTTHGPYSVFADRWLRVYDSVNVHIVGMD